MEANTRKPQLDKSAIVEALPAACVDEKAAVEFIEAQRWLAFIDSFLSRRYGLQAPVQFFFMYLSRSE